MSSNFPASSNPQSFHPYMKPHEVGANESNPYPNRVHESTVVYLGPYRATFPCRDRSMTIQRSLLAIASTSIPSVSSPYETQIDWDIYYSTVERYRVAQNRENSS